MLSASAVFQCNIRATKVLRWGFVLGFFFFFFERQNEWQGKIEGEKESQAGATPNSVLGVGFDLRILRS